MWTWELNVITVNTLLPFNISFPQFPLFCLYTIISDECGAWFRKRGPHRAYQRLRREYYQPLCLHIAAKGRPGICMRILAVTHAQWWVSQSLLPHRWSLHFVIPLSPLHSQHADVVFANLIVICKFSASPSATRWITRPSNQSWVLVHDP